MVTKQFFLDCVLVIMIISFASVIPESCLERFFRGCVGRWKPGPLPPCLLPSLSPKPSNIVKKTGFLETLALPPQVLVGVGTGPQPGHSSTRIRSGAGQGGWQDLLFLRADLLSLSHPESCLILSPPLSGACPKS